MARKRQASTEADYGDSDDYAPAPAPKRKAPRAPKRAKRTGTPDADAYADDVGAPPAAAHPASAHTLADARPLQAALLAWYARVHAARGMPWRKPYDPALGPAARAQRAYEVWVSEVMLQQTQVATVVPYYTRWMDRFPTIADLAAADIEAVNALWKGLGYYSRAARLLRGAQKAVAELGGALPTSVRALQAQIPGVGRYSAGAICSIAYNQCEPVLDGNVHRVLSRVLALHAPPKAARTLDVLWAAAAALARSARPGDVNQALIELGATVCTPRARACGACPLRPHCRAHRLHAQGGEAGAREGEAGAAGAGPDAADAVPDVEDCALCAPVPLGGGVAAYPMKAAKKRAREERDVVRVVEWRGGGARWFLLVRRPAGGLLAGLHEFPTAPDGGETAPDGGETAPDGESAADDLGESAMAALGGLLAVPLAEAAAHPDSTPAGDAGALRVAKVVPAGDVLHVFSHIRKTYRAQWVLLEGGAGPPALRGDGGEAGDEGGKSGDRRAGVAGAKAEDAAGAKLGRGRAGEGGAGQSEGGAGGSARWVRLEDVARANVGTGVLKVWKRVCALWA